MPEVWELFNPNIPRSNQSPAQSQPDIKANYQAVAALVDQNHYDFNQGEAGKHWVLGLPEQLTSPPLIQPDTGEPYVFKSGELGLYSFNFAGVSKELMLHTGYTTQDPEEIPITKSSILPGNDFTYLPSGMIFKFGIETFIATGSVDTTFLQPFSSVCFQVFITSQLFDIQSNIFVSEKRRDGFSVATNFNVAITGDFYWFAIGF